MISFNTTSLVKAIIAVGLSGCVMLLFYNRERFRPLLKRHETIATYLTFIGLRLIPFVIIYLILDQDPRSDVDFFYRKATAAFEGKIVYRDFLSYHAPLFGYLISLPLLLWHSAKSIVLLMAIIEFIVARATLRYFHNLSNDTIVWFVLYYLLPLPFVAMILSSEEDLWMWGIGLITLSLRPGRWFSLWVGVLWGVGMLTIKFTLIVFLIPLFFIVPNRFQYVAGLMLVGLPSLAILYGLIGTAFLMPIQHSELPMTPNMVSVLRPLLGTYFERIPLTALNWCGLLTTIGGASFVGHRFRTLGYRQLMPLLYVFTFNLFMICLPSAPGYYLFNFALPLVFVVLATNTSRRVWLAFFLLNLLTVLQPMLWVLYNKQALYNAWSQLDRPAEWADYLMQCVEVGLLIYMTRQTLKRVQQVSTQGKRTDLHPSPFVQ